MEIENGTREAINLAGKNAGSQSKNQEARGNCGSEMKTNKRHTLLLVKKSGVCIREIS